MINQQVIYVSLNSTIWEKDSMTSFGFFVFALELSCSKCRFAVLTGEPLDIKDPELNNKNKEQQKKFDRKIVHIKVYETH
jgi:hypothetical protein